MSKDKPQNMQFQHTYMTKEKMDQAGQGAFAKSTFKSYIADGETALKDKIMGGATRDDVMSDVRRNLRQEMRRANAQSTREASRMQLEHRQLREMMQEALLKTREAVRRRKLLDARMLAEQSKQSNRQAEISENELSNMISDQAESAQLDLQNAGSVTEEGMQQKLMDLSYMNELRNQAEQNKTVTHHRNMFSLFRAIGKKMERDDIESEMKTQDEIIAEQKEILNTKTREWNRIRKTYEQDSFRQYYRQYDQAATRYRMLNRSRSDLNAPEKDVKEYVGEFDIMKLESTLEQLESNPYLDVKVEVKNKKENRSNAEEDLIKSHTKITAFGEADENGNRIRYKLNSRDFSGYEANRQLIDKDNPTALTEYNSAHQKVVYDADRLKLEMDEKDAAGEFINSEKNLEIVQAKEKKWFGARTLNGVYLNGEFISTDSKIIKDSKHAKILGKTGSWDKMAQKEKVRRAVLKASIFRQINSKTIQHAMGYDAGKAAGAAGVEKKMIDEIAEQIISKEGLRDWEKKVADEGDELDAVADMFGYVNKGSTNIEKDYITDHLKKTIFTKEYDKKILSGGHVLPDVAEADWEEALKSKNAEDRKTIPTAAKTKVAYDVIRQEIAEGGAAAVDVMDVNSRIGMIMENIKDDLKSLSDLSLLLLSHDTKPEYWTIARDICSKLLMTNFEKKVQGTFDSRFNRALAHGRSEEGQLMRIALIDELNANRSHWDPSDMLNALMPTRWKQFSENIRDKRGTSAVLAQKLTDGSILSFANDVFSSYFDITDNFALVNKDSLRTLGLVKTYTTALTSAMNMGAITEAGAYAISDLFDETEEHVNDAGKTEITHTTDARKDAISLAFTMAQNLLKIIKISRTFYNNKKKQAEKKAKKDPDYDPQVDLEYTQDCYYKMLTSGLGTILGISSAVSGFAEAKKLKSILSMAKSALATYEDAISIAQANKQVNRIKKTEDQLTALEDKEIKTKEDQEMLQVLGQNSQLQYGLACAKRKSRDERAGKIISLISNAGKTVINGIKAFWPEGKKNPIFIAVDAVWGTLMTGVSTVTEIIRSKQAVKANIEKMLGAEFRNVNRGVLDEVLRREAGIASSDYLTDLARIFMSIDTHVFMKEAGTDAEKIVGVKIAQTLFNNKEYNKENLGKMNISKLMGVMGVQGNFRGILKHSLA